MLSYSSFFLQSQKRKSKKPLIFNELWNRIVSSVVIRMTTEDTLQSQKTSARDTIALYGRVCIGAAGRMKTTKPFPEQHPYKPMLEREGFLVKSY